ncbi:MAG TPA: hypothetical protein VLT88_09950, partial [Desulfosarcina sp.]|nr:hypothetical protein [Desulfosarcina sp.]
ILAPFPGTEIREGIDRYDLQILTDDWRRYHANRAVVRTAAVGPGAMDEVVIDAERQFDQWLAEIGRRRDAGTISEQEAWPLTRLEHTVVIYDMMMQRLVEAKGAWPVEPGRECGKEALDRLVGSIEKDLAHPPLRIRAAVEFALAHDHLTVGFENGWCRWSWVEYLQTQ